MQKKFIVLIWICIFNLPLAAAFENTSVLPRGVRNLRLLTVNTGFSEKTDANGDKVLLSQPLSKEITFQRMLRNESEARINQIKAFLLANGFDENQAVGQVTADVKGQLTVYAPVFNYGVTEKLSVAIGLPVYSGHTAVEMGFQASEHAEAFINALADPANNQAAGANESAQRLNNLVAFLNQSLSANGYEELEDWNATALGDATIAAKYRFYEQRFLATALTAGVVAPTGRRDDPNMLHDIGFGDGQWDLFSQLTVDEPLIWGLTVNQYGRYTWQLADKKKMRDITEEETVYVENIDVDYKLGDKVDAGSSLRYEPSFGVLAGIGYVYFKKFADSYHDDQGQRKVLLEKNTFQESHNAEALVGYSSVPSFRRGEVKVPYDVTIGYFKQLSSKNMPVTDLTKLDLNIYF